MAHCLILSYIQIKPEKKVQFKEIMKISKFGDVRESNLRHDASKSAKNTKINVFLL